MSSSARGWATVAQVLAGYTDSHDRPFVDEYSISIAPYLGSLFLVTTDNIKGRMCKLVSGFPCGEGPSGLKMVVRSPADVVSPWSFEAVS